MKTLLRKLSISLYNLGCVNHSLKVASLVKEVPEDEEDWEKVLGQKPAQEREDEWLEGIQGQSWIQVLESLEPDDDYQTMLQKIDSSNKFTQSEDSPEGDFRIVLFPLSSEDFVVKVGKDSAGNMMNKEDFSLGNYSDIMTKCYKHDPMFKWVVMEKIKVIGHTDRTLMSRVLDNSFKAEKEAYLNFCKELKEKISKAKSKIPKRPGLENERIMPGHQLWGAVRSDYLAISNEINKEFNPGIDDDDDDFEWVIDIKSLAKLVESDEFRACNDPMNIFKCIKNSMQVKRTEEGSLTDLSEIWNRKIRESAGKTYLELSNAISRFGIAIKDIRPNNIGCDSSYNFKILDSSIERTMMDAVK